MSRDRVRVRPSGVAGLAGVVDVDRAGLYAEPPLFHRHPTRDTMSASKRLTPVRRLELAMDRCALARSEVNWTNGYRAAKGYTEPEDARLFEKEMAQWKNVERADAAFCRLAQRVLRETNSTPRR